MSASTPAIEPHRARWWLLSVALHGVLLGPLFYLGPWQQLKSQASQQRHIAAHHAQRANTNALRQKVQALKEIETAFNRLHQWRQAIPPAARQAHIRAVEAQRQALQAQHQALDELARQAARPPQRDRQRLEDAFTQTQTAIHQAQQAAAQAQQLLGARDAHLQDQAQQAQENARLAQETAFETWAKAAQMGQALDDRPYWQQWFPPGESARENARKAWEQARQDQIQAWEAQQQALSQQQAVHEAAWQRAATDTLSGTDATDADPASLFAQALASGATIQRQYEALRAEYWAELQEHAPSGMAESLSSSATDALFDLDSPPAAWEDSEALVQATDQALERAQSRLALALGWSQQGQGRSLNWMPQASHSTRLLELAQQDYNQPARDLSALMRAANPTPSATTAHLSSDSHPSPIQAQQPTPPPLDAGRLRIAPGRKISMEGSGGEWLFIDSWYIIGPFPNPQRQHIDTRFPPESLVDLDATYIGKDGQVVGWEFFQTARAETVPPRAEEYAVYYAYTEFYVAEDMDLWVALGADDFAKVWLEDHLIWISGRHEKAWQINEGLRKVHFKKGPNRLLVRIENGWLNMGFSVAVSIAKQP